MVIRHEQRDVLDLSAATPVLFFEDNPADAHIVQLALEETPNQRFSIDIVDTFAKGIESLQRERYELVMLDLNLPDASGLESMRRLRAASELPVVVISGEADEQLAIDAVKAGAQDFVLKGQFHPELLGRLLTYAIERHAMEQQRLEAERERRRLMARLEDSQRFESLALLAGGVAHDFNNLLVSILGNADLAIREMAPNASGRDYLERIVHGAQRAADLSRQMLAYSGKGRIVVRPHDLTNLVKDTTEITKSSIAPEATLRFRLAKGLPPVEADATQLRQVILNLIINASEALQERPGTIVVSTGAMHCDRSYLEDTALKEPLAEGEYVFLEVADSGVGMTPATLARIFDPFFTTKFAGRGLGLAATLGIVRSHHGAIKVASKLGSGTTIRLLIPATDPVDMVVEDPKEPTRDAFSGTALVIDDDPSVRIATAHILAYLGLTVITAADGYEGIALVESRAHELSLIVLDLTMPRLSGEDTFREIKRIEPDLPVLLTSGYTEHDVMSSFVEQDLAGFIQKPFTTVDLLPHLRRILD